MDVLDGDVLYDIILKKYTRNQRGWSFRISPSERYGFDGLVTNGKEGWQLKFDTIFRPSPIVIGAPSEQNSTGGLRANAFPFGFRELEPSLFQRLLGGEDGSSVPAEVASILASVKPVVPRPGKLYAQGPFILSGRTAAPPLDESIDARLSTELQKRVRDRYPGYR